MTKSSPWHRAVAVWSRLSTTGRNSSKEPSLGSKRVASLSKRLLLSLVSSQRGSARTTSSRLPKRAQNTLLKSPGSGSERISHNQTETRPSIDLVQHNEACEVD